MPKSATFRFYARNALHQLHHWTHIRKHRKLRTQCGYYSLHQFDGTRSIFIHIPKTSGVSVCKSLYGNLGAGHRSVNYYKKVFGPATYYRYFTFAFVRNPFTRLLSAFIFLKKGGYNEVDRLWAEENLKPFATFEEFVLGWLSENTITQYYHFKPQHTFLCDSDVRRVPDVDFLGRFENLENDFHQICSRMKITATLGRHNTSGNARRITDFYNAPIRKKVAEIYRDDFEILGYDPSRLPPEDA